MTLGKSPHLSVLRSLRQVNLVHHVGTGVVECGLHSELGSVRPCCLLGLGLPTASWSSARPWKTPSPPDAGFPTMAAQPHLNQLQSRMRHLLGSQKVPSDSVLKRTSQPPLPWSAPWSMSWPSGPGEDRTPRPALLQKAFLPESVMFSSTPTRVGVGKSLAGSGDTPGWGGWGQSL